MFLVKKNCLFFRLSSQKKCGNTSELLNEHKKEMLARGSWDFIFLEMGKIFGIRKKILSVFSLLGFSPSPSFNNSYIRVRLISARSNVLKNIFFMQNLLNLDEKGIGLKKKRGLRIFQKNQWLESVGIQIFDRITRSTIGFNLFYYFRNHM